MSAVPVAPELGDAKVVKWSDGRLLTVIEDDWLVDPSTGELVGHLSELNGADGIEEITEQWCESIVRRRANAKAELVGLQAQVDMLIQGIRDRFQPRIRREENKLAWLDGPAGPMKEVIRFALERTQAKKKGKSYDFAYGRISFSKSGGKLEIVDEERATQFALTHSPKAVKVAIDLADVPEEVMPKAKELVSLLQSLAPGAITLSTRKSMIDLTEEAQTYVPELEPDKVDGENMPESGLVLTPVDEWKPSEPKH